MRVQFPPRPPNKVIVDGNVQEWVGIRWIELNKATEEDLKKYPTLVDG